jgi:hypothetical protein
MYSPVLISINIVISSPIPRLKTLPTSLNKIPEPLGQLQFLIVRIDRKILISPNPIISNLLHLQLPIQAVKHRPENKATSNRSAEHSQRNRITPPEPIRRQAPDVGARDVSDLGEGVYHGDRDGAFGRRAREGGGNPGVEDDEARVGAGLQEEGDVAGGDDLGRHADYEADHAHADWADDVPELGGSVSGMRWCLLTCR